MPLFQQTLTPTARLALLTLEKLSRPLSYLELAIETGCSVSSLQIAMPVLTRRELVERDSSGSVVLFSLPANTGGAR